MRGSWFTIGALLFLLLVAFVFPFLIGVPWDLVFSSDALDYSTGAKNLLLHGFYTFDGVHPFIDREPVMSTFLAVVYAFSGIENGVAVAAVQALILFFSAWFFVRRLSLITGERAAGIAFFLILISGSVLHTVFSAYRECLLQSLLLIFTGYAIRRNDDPAWVPMLMGLLLGLIILTYYSFVFLPIFLLAAWLTERRSLRELGIIFLIGGMTVSLWGFRNMSYDGHFRIIDNRRTAVMWYVRGEQAEQIHGLEPFWCLYSEYISRNWDGRSSACSFNGLMHRRWPDGFDMQKDYADVAAAGKAKILAHFPSYLWFSVFEVLELHAPYVGGGWSRAFNVYAAFTQLLLGIGFLLGIFCLRDRRIAPVVFLALYNTGAFILTDATPRYMLPVFFCYAAIAGIGYNWLLQHTKQRS